MSFLLVNLLTVALTAVNTGLDIIMLVLYNQRTVGLRFLASFPKMEMHAQQKLTSLLNIHTNFCGHAHLIHAVARTSFKHRFTLGQGEKSKTHFGMLVLRC